MTKPWTESKGPILSTNLDVAKANAIASLLTRPIALLPRTEGEPIKPFAIGIWNEIDRLRDPNASATPLRRAIGVYTHSKRYLFACAQPDAFRHDIDGHPLESISEHDRLAAQEAFLKLSRNVQMAAPQAPAVVVPEVSKADLIRAGLRPRKTA